MLAELQNEGKVASLGLSNVTVADIEEAGRHFTVATVQNRYNLTDGSSEDVLDHCTAHGIGFIPWAPISAGELAAPGGPVHEAAKRLGATPGQVALAWLLRRSPAMLPIPGTGSIAHLEENLAAAELELDDDDVRGDHRRALIPAAPKPQLLGFVGLARSTDRADPTNPSSCASGPTDQLLGQQPQGLLAGRAGVGRRCRGRRRRWGRPSPRPCRTPRPAR